MTQPTIDPGEGWRLLEPGEVIREGDEWALEQDWNRSIAFGEPIEKGEVYRRRITPAASPWIPVSEKPLPESGLGWVTYDNGNVRDCRQNGFEDITPVWRDRVIAWMPWELPEMPLPEPYVPPEPEMPRRCGVLPCGLKWVEHRDGDVDPDAANEARKYTAKHSTMGSEDYQIAMRTVHRMLAEKETS